MAKKDRLSEDGAGPTLIRILLKALAIAVVMWLIQRIGSS
jgi:hypothetical protein